MLENGILSINLHARIGLQQQIRAAGEQEIRSRGPCLNDTALKKSGVPTHNCAIHLRLAACHDNPYAGRRRSDGNEATAGDQGDRGLYLDQHG
jgi:hypothetical protein